MRARYVNVRLEYPMAGPLTVNRPLIDPVYESGRVASPGELVGPNSGG